MVTVDTTNTDSLTRWINALTRAREEGITLRGIRSRRNIHNALVTSSDARHTYYVMADTRTGTAKVYCTCLSGHHNQICKHAALVMDTIHNHQFGPDLMQALSAESTPQEAA